MPCNATSLEENTTKQPDAIYLLLAVQ